MRLHNKKEIPERLQLTHLNWLLLAFWAALSTAGIRTELMRTGKCPQCGSTKYTNDDLLPNMAVRQAVARFKQSQMMSATETMMGSQGQPAGEAADWILPPLARNRASFRAFGTCQFCSVPITEGIVGSPSFMKVHMHAPFGVWGSQLLYSSSRYAVSCLSLLHCGCSMRVS